MINFIFWMELLTGTVPVNNSLLTGTPLTRHKEKSLFLVIGMLYYFTTGKGTLCYVEYSTINKTNQELRVGVVGWEAVNREVCMQGVQTRLFFLLSIVRHASKQRRKPARHGQLATTDI